MLNPYQFRTDVVAPAIKALGPRFHTPAAEGLVFCTALAESNLTYLRQHGDGPALGLFQVEVATFNDIYRRYLGTRPDITRNLQPLMTGEAPHLQLITNLSFAAAICRLRYWMDPSPLPAYEDADGMGATWKRVYNTELGAGVPAHFADLYRKYVL
ncbi:hypothetical protein T8K17_11190 [Thalassobaculum sp. OXR-137]|uniref:hypothetical protein n=1 Tax=Thalassobaculum sp. OXR-137 TaxID=3100173 RepID=UPI002AC9B8FD|nr:hypothetical protein [Thalassobaculum sp. OXR-137]WPZ36699.1 hypothetical protein T8K17_11190 [Thalassobaculum sp. OXR-137]